MMDYNITLLENDTVIDDNPFLDSDESIHHYNGVHQAIKVIYLIGVLTKILAGTLCLASDIYLIVIMSKFKNLRTKLNKYILLYVIFNLCYMVLVNIILIIVMKLSGGGWSKTYFVLLNLDHLFMTLTFYVLTFMVFEWYVYNYNNDFYKRHTNVFKHGVLVVTLLAIPKWFISTLSCFVTMWNSKYVRLFLEGISFAISVIIVLTITILKNRKTPLPDAYKTEYVLQIARTVLLCFLPFYINWIIFEIVIYNIEYATIYINIFLLTEYISEFFSYMASVFVLYKLSKLNKYFKIAFLKCCKKNVDQYEDEDLDSESLHSVQVKTVTYDKEANVVINI